MAIFEIIAIIVNFQSKKTYFFGRLEAEIWLIMNVDDLKNFTIMVT